jgi:elongation of very long chain fatty acids protein 4
MDYDALAKQAEQYVLLAFAQVRQYGLPLVGDIRTQFNQVQNHLDVVDSYEGPILEFFHPGNVRETESWAVCKLGDAVALAEVYFAIAMVGVFCKVTGILKDFSALDFVYKPIMFVYNCTQVALCAYMMYGAVVVYNDQNYEPYCNKYDPKRVDMARMTHIFYLSKILDFADTLFMVLRGKHGQITFLHIYHHISIFLIYWLNANAGYDGDIFLTIVLNSFIHFIMYGYYAFTSLPVIGKFRIFKLVKPLITNCQMIQFLCMNAQAFALLANDCPFPKRITILYIPYIFSLLLLFANFSKKTYKKGDKANKKLKTQ